MATFSIQIRRMLNPGVVQIAERRYKKAADGWIGSKSIHPKISHRRAKNMRLYLDTVEHYDPRQKRVVV